jgi:hypothetical protein
MPSASPWSTRTPVASVRSTDGARPGPGVRQGCGPPPGSQPTAVATTGSPSTGPRGSSSGTCRRWPRGGTGRPPGRRPRPSRGSVRYGTNRISPLASVLGRSGVPDGKADHLALTDGGGDPGRGARHRVEVLEHVLASTVGGEDEDERIARESERPPSLRLVGRMEDRLVDTVRDARASRRRPAARRRAPGPGATATAPSRTGGCARRCPRFSARLGLVESRGMAG